MRCERKNGYQPEPDDPPPALARCRATMRWLWELLQSEGAVIGRARRERRELWTRYRAYKRAVERMERAS